MKSAIVLAFTRSRICFSVTIPLLLFTSWGGVFAEVSTKVGHQEIVAAWKERQQQSRNVTLTWTEEVLFPEGSIKSRSLKSGKRAKFPLSDEVVTRDAELVFEGNSAKYSVNGPHYVTDLNAFAPRQYVSATNGAKSKSLLGSGTLRGTEFHAFGTVTKTTRLFDADSIHTLPARLWFRPFDQVFGAKLDLEQYSIVGLKEIVNDRSCVTLERRVSNSRSRIWVSNSKSFCPVRYQEFVDDKLVASVEYDLREEIGDLAIRGWESRIYILGSGSPTLMEEGKAKVHSIAVNTELPARVFELSFPAGALVNDALTKEYYILKANGTKRMITDEECQFGIDYKLLASTESGQARLTPPASFPWLTLVLFVLLILAAAMGMWRFRGQRTHGLA